MADTAIQWCDLEDEDDGWQQTRCLYAYWASDGELLYVGKAWGKTVRERWQRSAKPHFWDDIERHRGVHEHTVGVGSIHSGGQRLTHQLLADIESLLIHRLQPWGNLQSRLTRIKRVGLTVHCYGDWFNGYKSYRDRA